MALGSKVAYQARAKELGIDQAAIDALEAKSIISYATYAYCCTFQPGQVDDSALKVFSYGCIRFSTYCSSLCEVQTSLL